MKELETEMVRLKLNTISQSRSESVRITTAKDDGFNWFVERLLDLNVRELSRNQMNPQLLLS
jgi:hypothetical protein